jgi:hypothetical protein
MSVRIAAAGQIRVVLRAAGLAVAVAVAAPMTVMAQRVSDARVAMSHAPSSVTPLLASSSGSASPAAAGLMSLVIPGLGSFYAGYGRHGGTHLGIAAASLAVMVAGVAAALSECPILSDQPCNSSGGSALAAIGFVTYGVNDIVSVFTAINDANRKNAAGAAP